MAKKKKTEEMPLPEGISMEEFGPVAVDVFTGRRVESVTEQENGAVWAIHFEGNGAIYNFDPLYARAPKQIIGAALTMTILGGHTDPDTNTPITRLMFGLEEVVINPLQYAIIDPNFTKGQLVFAQRSTVNMIPPHPDERIADGPDPDWQPPHNDADDKPKKKGRRDG